MTALQIVNAIFRDKLRLQSIATIEGVTGITLTVLWAVNEIQRELVKAYDWAFLKKYAAEITLATDTDTYDLASDFSRFLRTKNPLYYEQINDGSDTDIDKITVVDDDTFMDHTSVNTTQDKPYVARFKGHKSASVKTKQIQFHYTPSSTYNGTKVYYDYIYQPADFALDADVSPFDDLWLIEGGYKKYKQFQGRLTQADIVDYIASLIPEMENQHSGRSRTLKYRDI